MNIYYIKYKDLDLKQFGGNCDNTPDIKKEPISKKLYNSFTANELITLDGVCYSVDDLYKWYKNILNKDEPFKHLVNPNQNYTEQDIKRLVESYEKLKMTGVNYLKQNIEILDLKKKNSIYAINGHGCSLDEEYEIPENCQYVTYGLCGDVIYADSKRNKFIELFCNYPDIFQNPKDNIFQLRSLFDEDINVHYHNSGSDGTSTYMNAIYSPMLDWMNDPSSIRVEKSGLFRAGSGCTNLPMYEKRINSSDNILSYDAIKYIFSNSLYPTVANIIDNNPNENTLSNINDQFKIDQKTLFDHLPGIYYNTVCRPACKGGQKLENDLIHSSFSSKTRLRRILSNNIHESFTSQFKITTLHLLSQTGDSDQVQVLLKDNKDELNKQDPNGNTPLHFACEYNNIEIVKTLIDAGSKLNLKNKDGNSPLHIVCMKNLEDVIEILIKSDGINLNSVNNNLHTPLDITCDSINGQLTLLLLNAGASIKDVKIYQKCYKSGNRKIYEKLVDMNAADINR